MSMAAVAALLAMAFTMFGAGRVSAGHPDCQFVLGFEALQAAIPDAVGDCLENENHDPSDRITRQQTTRGVCSSG
ncbi:MAG: hypothetical protein OXG33_03925 [Chloroflexi bacterium]|nr:hypothetical protein [Chloroflexota bacterium]